MNGLIGLLFFAPALLLIAHPPLMSLFPAYILLFFCCVLAYDALRHGNSGTELGLSIARNIVQAHGGAIQLESVQGEDATARIWLPY